MRPAFKVITCCPHVIPELTCCWPALVPKVVVTCGIQMSSIISVCTKENEVAPELPTLKPPSLLLLSLAAAAALECAFPLDVPFSSGRFASA